MSERGTESIGRHDRLVPRDFKIDARAEVRARLQESRIKSKDLSLMSNVL